MTYTGLYLALYVYMFVYIKCFLSFVARGIERTKPWEILAKRELYIAPPLLPVSQSGGVNRQYLS